MKKLIILPTFIMTISQLASAGIVWTSAIIPEQIQQRVESAVSANCNVQKLFISERESAVRSERVDQEVFDYFYNTTLVLSQNQDQSILDDVQLIEVQVAHYSFSNPLAGDPIKVQVRGVNSKICE